MLITEEYRELNRQLHVQREDYGKYGSKWAPLVFGLCAQLETHDVLDYGSGKGTLNLHLPFEIHQYDPAVAKHQARPKPADIVVCTDVMEHVEDECIDDVLNDLHSLTKQRLLLNIATREAVKTLPDGRNAHVSVHPFTWWATKLFPRFESLHLDQSEGEFTCILEPHHGC